MSSLSTLQYARQKNTRQEILRQNAQYILFNELQYSGKIDITGEADCFRTFLNCGSSRDEAYRHNDKFTLSISPDGFSHLLESTCNSSFLCPCCSQRMMRKKSEELTTMILNAQEMGYSVYLVTHTIPHRKDSKLSDLMKNLSACITATYDSRSFRDVKDMYSYVGFIRCFDITFNNSYDGNGWHPHLHNVLIFEDHIDPDELRSMLFPEYRSQIERVTGMRIDSRAFDVSFVATDEGVAEYVSKLHLTQYITKSEKDKAATNTMYPFDLLVQDEDGEFPYADYFVEYAYATRGVAKIRTSRGLKSRLLTPEQSEQFDDSMHGEQDNTLMDIPRPLLKYMSLERHFLKQFVSAVELMDNDMLCTMFSNIVNKRDEFGRYEYSQLERDAIMAFYDEIYMSFFDRALYEGSKWQEGSDMCYWGAGERELATEFVDLGEEDYLFDSFDGFAQQPVLV